MGVRAFHTWLIGTALALGCAAAPDQSPGAPVAGATAQADAPQPEQTEPLVTLPLRQLVTHHIVVPVALRDGEPVDFILDTGASMSVITPATRDALGFAPDEGMVAQGKGAGGSMSEVRVVIIDRLRVGDRRYENHTVAVTDLSHLEAKLGAPIGGILGANFLDKHVVEIDFPAKKLLLHPGGALEDGSVGVGDMGRIEYEQFAAGGLIKVAVSLDGKKPMPAVLDLGAGRTVMNWKAAKAAGVTRRSKGLRRPKEPLLGADSKPIETAGYTFERVELGAASFARPEIFMADLPVFETLGIAADPAMIFGVDMFRDRRIVLDYGARTLYVSAPLATAVIQG